MTTLNRLGGIAESLGDFVGARRQFEEALDVARIAQDAFALAWALYWLGRLSSYQGRFDETKETLEEALLLSRRLGHRQLIVLTLLSTGGAAYRRGDLAVADASYREALYAADSLEDRTSLALCLAGLADVEIARENFLGAREWLAGLDHDDPLVSSQGRAALLASRAALAWEQRNASRAVELHRRALVLSHSLQAFYRIPDHLEQLGLIALRGEQERRAAKLLGAAARLRLELGTVAPDHTKAEVQREGQRLQAGEPEAWRAGWKASVREAVTFARA